MIKEKTEMAASPQKKGVKAHGVKTPTIVSTTVSTDQPIRIGRPGKSSEMPRMLPRPASIRKVRRVAPKPTHWVGSGRKLLTMENT